MTLQPNPRTKKQRVANPEPVQDAPIKGLIKWSQTVVADHNDRLVSTLIATLLHLSTAHGPTEDEVGFICANSRPIALRDFIANEMKLFPYTSSCSVTVPDNGIYTVIEAIVGTNPPQKLYLCAPLPVVNPKSKNVHKVSPFWNAAKEPERANYVDLQCRTQEFNATLQVSAQVSAKAKAAGKKSSAQTSQVNEEFKAGKGPAKVRFFVPYLTNITAVQRGQHLRASGSEFIRLTSEF